MRRLVYAALVAVALGASTRTALARDQDDKEPARVLVRVGPSVRRAEASRLVSAVVGQLRGAAEVSTDDDGSPLTCAVDIDRNEAGQLIVRFADPSTHAALGERLVTHGGEVGASEVGTIVRAFIVAQRERPAPAPDPAPAPAAALPPPVVVVAPAAVPERAWWDEGAVPDAVGTADADAWRARLGLFYTGSSYAGALPWQSGVRVAAAASLPRGLYVGVAYGYFLPSVIVGDAASASLARHVGDACFGIERGLGVSVSVAADVGGGFAVDVRRTASSAAGVAATPDAVHVSPILRAAIHGRYRVPEIDALALDVAAALEVAPAERDLVVDDGKSTTTLLSPALARLRIDIGATFDAF